MSRFDPESNEWECKIVLFGPPTAAATELAQQVVNELPAGEYESFWAAEHDNTLIARYRPAASTLDVQPLYLLHALRSTAASATDRQHVLGNVDGVLLLIDADQPAASRMAARELERFLGTFGKMIATMPTVVLASATLSDEQLADLHLTDRSMYVADSADRVRRAMTTLTQMLEEDSGLGGFDLDFDALLDDDD